MNFRQMEVRPEKAVRQECCNELVGRYKRDMSMQTNRKVQGAGREMGKCYEPSGRCYRAMSLQADVIVLLQAGRRQGAMTGRQTLWCYGRQADVGML